jgi:long-chain acyl-CoA synthetase
MNGGPWLLGQLSKWGDRVALLDGNLPHSYISLLKAKEELKARLEELGCGAGAVVAVQCDYNCASISLLLACIDLSLIVAPLAPGLRDETKDLVEISEASVLVRIRSNHEWEFKQFKRRAANPLIHRMIDSGCPGLVIFSSGSTGTPKATLHDLNRFLAKYQRERTPLRTIAVPPMDHVAGLDTMFYCLASGGTLVCPESRSPSAICAAIERHQVELLPASATFLSLVLASGALEQHDLSSLRIIAYGSDVMPESTLSKLRELIPGATLLQKYGTTEFGSPTTKSRADSSLWLKIDDEGFETRIENHVLWVRSQSAMVGYLNAPNPFDREGWLNTGDVVEESETGHIRILGRATEVINVGGHKVYPAEVETVLLQLSNVEDAVVYGKPNPIMGRTVAARLRLKHPEDLRLLKRRAREFCRDRLASFKVPVEIDITEGDLITSRQKKIRRDVLV